MDKEQLKQALKELFESGDIEVNLTEKIYCINRLKEIQPVIKIDGVEAFRGEPVCIDLLPI